MSEDELRAKIRELMASGVLPKDPPPITREVPAAAPGNKPNPIPSRGRAPIYRVIR